MTEYIDPATNYFRHVSLTDAERERIRSRIILFTRQHPVSGLDSVAPQHVWQRVISRLRSAHLSRRAVAVGLVGVVLSLTLVTSAIAAGALPGDALYPVKLHLNEGLRSAFTFSASAKAAWESERVQRRLTEAEQLAVQGRLDTTAAGQLETLFQTHAEEARGLIEGLRQKGQSDTASRLSSSLESALRAHQRVLHSLFEKSSDADTLSPILDGVKLRVDSTAQVRTDSEDDVAHESTVEVRAAAEASQQSAQHVIDAAVRFLAQAGGQGDAESFAQAHLDLVAAHRLFEQALFKLNAGAYAEAFSGFRQAQRLAQEAKIFAAARSRLNLQINQTPNRSDKKSEREGQDKASERSSDGDKGSSSHTEDSDPKTLLQIRGEIDSMLNSGTGTPKSEDAKDEESR